MDIAMPLYDRFTALDAVGPYEVLSRLPDTTVHFLGADGTGPKKTETGMLTILTERSLEDLPHPEVIVVPVGYGTRDLMRDERVLEWVREAHATSTWTTSVCTGSLLLGAAGLLDGLEATTHWSEAGALKSYGATYTARRVVEQPGGIITAAGVSSGIDMALRLAELIAGRVAAEAYQLAIEYDPQPPFDSGSLAKASQEAKDHLAARSG
jgi:transcriptional regulator GlxA family with amidase domain